MTITAKELLKITLEGNTTLRDVFYGAIEDGAFGADICLDTDEKEQVFYEQLAQKIINAVSR